MNLSSHLKNSLLFLKVIPNAKHTELKEENDHLKLYVHAPPEKDKANKEVIRFFKKEYNLQVEIKSGEKSREKVLRIVRCLQER
ncbi:MAG: DUF167 domain-containing protein [Nanoarchaeota archaeon]